VGRRVRIVAGSIAVVAIVAASSIGIGRAAFDRRIDGEIDELLARQVAVEPMVVAEDDLAGLPEPVQQWLRWSGVVDRPMPTTIRLRQEGEFRLGEERNWMPYDATEYFTTDPPGFVWSVTMEMAPMLTVVGRDRYAEGVGDIEMRLLGVVPVANERGGGLNQGALLRYLNEIMWFPAGALNPYISWEAIDATSARATMSHDGVTASAVFIFDAEGRLTNMTAERYNNARDEILPWSTPIHAYGEFDGVRLPTEGVGIWHYETGDYVYIRLSISEVEYDRAERF
jgi:hypothetical protein